MFSNLFGKAPTLTDQEIYDLAVKPSMDNSDKLINFYKESYGFSKLNNGLNASNQDPQKTVLHHAVEAGNLTLVTRLCAFSNLDLTIGDQGGNTVFHTLILKLYLTDKDKQKKEYDNLIKIFKILKEKSHTTSSDALAKPNNADKVPSQYLTSLFQGRENELLELKKELFSVEEEVQDLTRSKPLTGTVTATSTTTQTTSKSDTKTQPPLNQYEKEILTVIKQGNHVFAAKLVSQNSHFININTRDASNGFTFAHYALQNANPGTANLIDALIKAGISLDIGNNKGVAPLPFALLNYKTGDENSLTCIRLLINEGKHTNQSLGMDTIIDDDTFNDCPPIVIAIIKNIDKNIFANLLTLPGVMNTTDTKVSKDCHYEALRGKSAFEIIKDLQKKELMEILLNNKPKPNQNKLEQSPQHKTKQKKSPHTVSFYKAEMSRNEFEETVKEIFEEKPTTALGKSMGYLSQFSAVQKITGESTVSLIMKAYDTNQYSDQLNRIDSKGDGLLHRVVLAIYNLYEQTREMADQHEGLSEQQNELIKENEELKKLASLDSSQQTHVNKNKIESIENQLNKLNLERPKIEQKINRYRNVINIILARDQSNKIRLDLENSKKESALEHSIFMRTNDISVEILQTAISKCLDINIDHNGYAALTLAFNSNRVFSGQTDNELGFHLVYYAMMTAIKQNHYDVMKNQLLTSPFILNEGGRFKSSEHLSGLVDLVKRMPMRAGQHFSALVNPSEDLFKCYLELINMMKDPKVEKNINKLIEDYSQNTVKDAVQCLKTLSENYKKYKTRNNQTSQVADEYKNAVSEIDKKAEEAFSKINLIRFD